MKNLHCWNAYAHGPGIWLCRVQTTHIFAIVKFLSSRGKSEWLQKGKAVGKGNSESLEIYFSNTKAKCASVG